MVDRGFESGRGRLAPLYESLIDEVIFWPGFTSTSTDRDSVSERFIENKDSMLFEITLHSSDAAICIADHSDIPSESDIFIAAPTGLKIDEVEYVDLEIP
jgi:hypothetical protein